MIYRQKRSDERIKINIADKIDSRIEKCNSKDLMILEYLKSIILEMMN